MPGVAATGTHLNSLRFEVNQLLGRQSASFPGAQPVSFAAKHKLELQKQDYYVCEKSDGIRCLMYMTVHQGHEVTYLIDRKNDYYHVTQLHFPLASNRVVEFHTGTLVDGELVNEAQPDGSVQVKYLVFDCLVLDHSRMMHRTLDKRLAYFRDKVYNPYRELYQKYPEEVQYLPFIVDFKEMRLSYGIEMMFREVLPNLKHGNDGLIFTCKNTSYKFGTDQHILKWKSPNENSIDFMLDLEFPTVFPDEEEIAESGDSSPYFDYDDMPTFHLCVNMGDGREVRHSVMFVEEEEWQEMKRPNEPLHERIVECYLDDQQRWRFLRWRQDKATANHISTVNSVMESIRDRVTEEDLLNLAWNIRDEWKKRHAAEEDRPKLEADPQRPLSSSGPAHTENGDTQNGKFGGWKRKASDDDESLNDHTPPKKSRPLSSGGPANIENGDTQNGKFGGWKRKASDDDGSMNDHTPPKKRYSQSHWP